MEEQEERHNPINPKSQLHDTHQLEGSGFNTWLNSRKGQLVKHNMEGGSATPSMGLSQFRGGKHTLLDHLKNPKKGYGRTQKSMLSRQKDNSGSAQSKSEAHLMGQHLGKHLLDLHGGSFHKDFVSGMGMCGGGLDDDMDDGPAGYVRPVTRFDESGHRIPSSGSVNEVRAAQAKKNYEDRMSPSERAFKTINSGLIEAGHYGLDKAGSVIPGSEKVAEAVRGLIPKRGGHKSGAYEGMGAPKMLGRSQKKKRAPAMEGDGRRKRAEIVKKVMAEKGMKMIEASKYVKEHGLY